MSLFETVLALGLSMLVILAVETMFVDSLRFRVLNDKVMTRTMESEVIDVSMAADVAESDLRLATAMSEGRAVAPLELDADVSPEPAPIPESPAHGLTAIALPRARDPHSGRFEIHPRTAVPVWTSVRVTFQRAGQRLVQELDVARADGGEVHAPVDPDSLVALCDGQAPAVGGWVRTAGPKVVSRNIERFMPTVLHRRLTWSDNEPIETYALFITARRDDTRVEGGPTTRSTFTRLYRSWNSTFRDPGPLKMPLPVPVPPARIDAGKNEW
ncbi:MAG: hypothetical protein EB084_16080 [Proteobacteria bacterium]|nr:hypothetical protein [Pseudomonadota bacterium]